MKKFFNTYGQILTIIGTVIFILISFFIFQQKNSIQKEVDSHFDYAMKTNESIDIANKDFPTIQKTNLKTQIEEYRASLAVSIILAQKQILIAEKTKDTIYAKYFSLNPEGFQLRLDYSDKQYKSIQAYDNYYKEVYKDPEKWIVMSVQGTNDENYNSFMLKKYNQINIANKDFEKTSNKLFDTKFTILDSIKGNPRLILTYALILLIGLLSFIGSISFAIKSIKLKNKLLFIKNIIFSTINIVGFVLIGLFLYFSIHK